MARTYLKTPAREMVCVPAVASSQTTVEAPNRTFSNAASPNTTVTLVRRPATARAMRTAGGVVSTLTLLESSRVPKGVVASTRTV
jgi:hypothetical protein